MIITIQNYFQEKQHIDWSKVSDTLKEDLENIELIIETAIDVPESLEVEEIKTEIDEFLKELNKQLKRKSSTPKKSTSSVKKKTQETQAQKKVSGSKSKKRMSTKTQIEETIYFKRLVPYNQQLALIKENSSENDKLIERIEKELASTPKQGQGKFFENSIAYIHYFEGNRHWYITDINEENNQLYGHVLTTIKDYDFEEGYFDISSLTNEDSNSSILDNVGIQLDFYFQKDSIKNLINKHFSNDVSKQLSDQLKKEKPKRNTLKTKSKTKQKIISKTVDIKTVDHFTTEYRLIRRFYNLIRLNKTASFRKIQLVYMVFQKAALDRSIRKTSKDADLFTKVNKKVIALFDIVNPKKDDATIEFTNQKLFEEMETYVKEQKVNYAVTLLKSFVGMQGYTPDIAKVERLLKRIDNALEKEKINNNNRLYQEVINAKKELEVYLKDSSQKIEPKLVGLSRPANSLQTNKMSFSELIKDENFQIPQNNHVDNSKKKAI